MSSSFIRTLPGRYGLPPTADGRLSVSFVSSPQRLLANAGRALALGGLGRREGGARAAVDDERLAGHEARQVGDEENERTGDLLGLAIPGERYPLQAGL